MALLFKELNRSKLRAGVAGDSGRPLQDTHVPELTILIVTPPQSGY